MESTEKQKDRSPNYPSISLEAAYDAVQKLHESDGTSPVPQEALIQNLGHKMMSGPARSKIAAVRQYGLIESAGGGKIRVSDRALPLFYHQPQEREFRATLKDLALMPPLFGQLYGQYAQASENTLRLHLVRERKFSPEGAKRLARVFKDTLTFAKLSGQSYNRPESEAEDEIAPEPETTGGSVGEPPVRSLPRTGVHPVPVEAGALSVDYLPHGLPTRVTFARRPTPRTIQRLIDYLKMLKDDFADEPGEATTTSEVAD
jgi:hypothetical protein